MNFTNFADWPAWLQILTGFAAWASLYLWTAKTKRGQYARMACDLSAILFYFLFLRPSRN
jgi:hypothetical protein